MELPWVLVVMTWLLRVVMLCVLAAAVIALGHGLLSLMDRRSTRSVLREVSCYCGEVVLGPVGNGEVVVLDRVEHAHARCQPGAEAVA